MVTTTRKVTAKRRTAPQEKRRAQLIKATIRSIAKCGLPGTTMATVTREAKLSLGIVNLHFKSKERLLVETLRYIAEEYRANWEKAFDKSGPSNGDKLRAIIEAEFAPPVCEPNKLAACFAFWSESKSRATYRKIWADLDKRYDAMLIKLCARIIAEGPYPGVDPKVIATGLSAMNWGLWLDILVNPDSMNAEKAKGVSLAYLSSVFPQHFGA